MRPALEVMVAGLDQPEGIAWDERRRRLVLGTAGGVVQAFQPDTGELDRLASGGGFLLGVALDAAGAVYACDMTHGVVHRVAAAGGRLERFADGSPGGRMRVPNYVVTRLDGGMWVSDSGSCWDAADGTIWSVDPSGAARPATDEPLSFPNGLALAADGTELLCLETSPPRLLSLPVLADGRLGRAREVVGLAGTVPDGLLVLADGSVLVVCYRPDQILRVSADRSTVDVLAADPQGRLLAGCANACLFDPELDRVAVTNVGGNHLTVLAVPPP